MEENNHGLMHPQVLCSMRNYLPSFCLIILVGTAEFAAAEVDFDRDIRPILSENCFPCHGPDTQARQAEVRLDTRDGLFAQGSERAIIQPESSADSELFLRVSSDDPDLRMPPPDSGLTLNSAQQAQLREWIDQGAVWSDHWAFEPVRRPSVPTTADPAWSRNPIDHFIARRHAAAQITPSPEAERRVLIRRATLDLTGLPPTPEEVAAFVNDAAPNAYERLVDRLLFSPRYGERVAWNWMDAARYADTDGFQGDPTRTMWPWRDWLIQTLNDNLPFDEFTVTMLAGDQLPNATAEQVVATGFNRNHMHNGEGGRIAEETRVENVFDRTETTSTVWLGLTMTCARCHDHKYDPIAQQEYYQLYAFFNNTSENGARGGGRAAPTLGYLKPDQRQRLDQLQEQVASLERQLRAPDPEVDKAQASWETEMVARIKSLGSNDESLTLTDWQQVGPFPTQGNTDQSLKQEHGPEKNLDLSQKYLDGKLAWTAAPQFTDGKVHELSSAVGSTYLQRVLNSPDQRTVSLSLGSDDGIRVWLNEKLLLSKYAARAAQADQEMLDLELQPGENRLLIKIYNSGGISGFYFQKRGESVAGVPTDIAAILRSPLEKRKKAETARLLEFYRSQHSDAWKATQAELKKVSADQKSLRESATTVMVMDDLAPERRRVTKILDRGIYNKPTDIQVEPGTPAFLPNLPESERNRLGLARWLTDKRNPLTARVTVNRSWQLFFSRGLVETTEDLGRQGSRPSHPELLDWLAAEFAESGWDVKRLHRLIVTSRTYRQSSRVTQDSLEKDFDNRLLSRAPRYRLPSWMIRDQALAVSGLLVDRIGGPPVRPYQPEGIWADATFGKIRYRPDTGSRLYRRSLYIFWRRIVGPTMFFDAGKRQTCEVKPTRTNTPMHALTTLNETGFVEAARMLATRVVREGGTSVRDRIERAFLLATTRHPTEDELALLVRRYELTRTEFDQHPEQATELLNVGASAVSVEVPETELASLTLVTSLILNLDEVLTRE